MSIVCEYPLVESIQEFRYDLNIFGLNPTLHITSKFVIFNFYVKHTSDFKIITLMIKKYREKGLSVKYKYQHFATIIRKQTFQIMSVILWISQPKLEEWFN